MKIEKKLPEETLPALLLLAGLVFSGIMAAGRGPDTDAWWLSATGRVLTEQGFVKENPFCLLPGLKFVVQQPIPCLLNYIFDAWLGMGGLWLLSMLQLAGVLFSAMIALKKAGAERYRTLLILATLTFVVARSSLLTTRPYLLTMSISFLDLAIWLSHGRSERTKKRTIIALLLQMLLAVLQANIQASSLIILFLWPMCFLFPEIMADKGSVRSLPKRMVPTIRILLPCWICTFLGSILNPYGLDNTLYLIRSAKAVRTMAGVITEMHRPAAFSFQTMLILLSIFMVLLAKKEGHLEPWQAYLAFGASVLSLSYDRNAWIIMVAACLLCGVPGRKIEGERKKESSIPCAMLLTLGLAGGILAGSAAQVPASAPEGVEILQKAAKEEEIRVMSAFGTGGYLEHAGIKCFVDARIELTSEDVCGTPVMEEWYRADLCGIGTAEFLDKYQFDYIVTSPGVGYAGYYARYSDDWEALCASPEMMVYRRKE